MKFEMFNFRSSENVFLFLLLALGFTRLVQAGQLNPFDDDPAEAHRVPPPPPPPPPSPPPPSAPLSAPKVYSCPADNGATYTTSGVTFTLKCGHGTTAKLGSRAVCPSLTACADRCAKEPTCQSCDWNSYATTCSLFTEYIPTVPYDNVNTWFPTSKRDVPPPKQPDPPPKPEPPRPIDPPPQGPSSCPPPVAPGTIFKCPADDKKTYTTANGKTYMLKCDYQSPNAKPLKNTPCTSIMDCAEQCSKEDASVICDWSENNCAMKQQYIEPFHQAGVNTWIDIDKAPNMDPCVEDFPDEGTVVCSTACPSANGVIHDTPAGERFHIDCGRRHAVPYIYKDTQSTLESCINACGALLACHSVDWNQNTKVCYYGQHHGEPQMLAPSYSSAHTLGCAGASCKKDGPRSSHTEL